MSIAEPRRQWRPIPHLLRNTNGTADNNIFRAMGWAPYRYVHLWQRSPSSSRLSAM